VHRGRHRPTFSGTQNCERSRGREGKTVLSPGKCEAGESGEVRLSKQHPLGIKVMRNRPLLFSRVQKDVGEWVKEIRDLGKMSFSE